MTQKEDAKKFLHKLDQLQNEKDEQNAKPAAAEDAEPKDAPADVQEYFDHIEDLKKNNALFVKVDGSVSEAVGPAKLASAAEEADGAIAIVFNGPVSKRTIEIASESAIETVVGTTAGKGCEDADDVKVWLQDQFA